MIKLYTCDPCHDPRWPALLASHPAASIFHTPGWLRALQRTYGYQPIVFTTSSPGQPLENGIVFCRVSSWLTGTRLVSLPFSDHCQPLARESSDLRALYASLEQELAGARYKYVELRPRTCDEVSLGAFAARTAGDKFYFHELDLRPDLDTVYRGFHKNCVQRKIRRAEREPLTYEAGRSESILTSFYHLQLLTRRRHQLPPQPMSWFRNLVDCLGEQATVRVLSKDRQPVAGILTFSFKSTLVYKYGGSDAGFHNLGGMPLLFWKAIEEAKRGRAEQLDLGRSDTDNPGLVIFKEHLGARRSELAYWRIGSRKAGRMSTGRQLRMVRHALARMPRPVAQIAGDALYRHMG